MKGELRYDMRADSQQESQGDVVPVDRIKPGWRRILDVAN